MRTRARNARETMAAWLHPDVRFVKFGASIMQAGFAFVLLFNPQQFESPGYQSMAGLAPPHVWAVICTALAVGNLASKPYSAGGRLWQFLSGLLFVVMSYTFTPPLGVTTGTTTYAVLAILMFLSFVRSGQHGTS